MIGRTVKVISGQYVGRYGKVIAIRLDGMLEVRSSFGHGTIYVESSDIKFID